MVYAGVVFEKHEHRYFREIDPQRMALRLYDAGMRQWGIELRPISPNVWQGKGPVYGLGYRVKVTAVATSTGYGPDYSLGVKVEADLEDKGIAFLAVGFIFCLPAGLLVLLMIWLDFRGKQDQVMRSLWEGSAITGPWG